MNDNLAARVLKYQLTPGTQMIDLPLGSVPLHVHEQNGAITLWVEVHEDGFAKNNHTQYTFVVLATGEEFQRGPRTDSMTYIGTAHINWTVWHVYHQKRV